MKMLQAIKEYCNTDFRIFKKNLWAVKTSPNPHWITPHFQKKVITLLLSVVSLLCYIKKILLVTYMKRRYDACRFIRVERWRVFYKRHSVWMRFFSLIQFNCCFSMQRFLKIGVMTCLHDFEVFPLQQLNFKISTGKLFVKNDFARSILFKRGKSLQNLLQILRCYQSNSSNL